MTAAQRTLVLGGLFLIALIMHVCFFEWDIDYRFGPNYGFGVAWGFGVDYVGNQFTGLCLGVIIPLIIVCGGLFIYLGGKRNYKKEPGVYSPSPEKLTRCARRFFPARRIYGIVFMAGGLLLSPFFCEWEFGYLSDGLDVRLVAEADPEFTDIQWEEARRLGRYNKKEVRSRVGDAPMTVRVLQLPTPKGWIVCLILLLVGAVLICMPTRIAMALKNWWFGFKYVHPPNEDSPEE